MMFFSSETGAVTVDWVVLTAGVVGLGLAATAVVSSGVEDVAGDTADVLNDSKNRTLIRSSFDGYVHFSADGNSFDNISTYGSSGATWAVSDQLGSVSGDTAYVITSNPNDQPGGQHAGGLAFPIPEDELEIGATYTISYWARAETGTVSLHTFNTEGGKGVNDFGVLTEQVGTEWTYVEQEVTLNDTRSHWYLSTQQQGVTFAIDDVQVMKNY